LYEAAFASSENPDQQKRYRNELIFAMMGAADFNTVQHLARVLGTRVAFDITTGSIVLATATASAISGGTAGMALAGVAAGTKGLEELFHAQIYQNTIVPALIS